jgi:uncharacterized membrane protein
MASLHPEIVHFTVALAVVGVLFRLISLTGRPAFAGPLAATLIILAAVSSVAAVQSGADAHGPVERVPGARGAVVEHEEWGERARNGLLLAGIAELIALFFARSPKARAANGVAAAVGVVALFCVYEAAEHGGELVYSYAGGVGIRSGDPKDVERLLLAGVYHQALADRKAGRTEQAAELIALAARRFPGDVEVRLLAAESQLLDVKNTQAAIDALAAIQVPADNRVLRTRRAMLQADAFEAAGQKDAAVAVLQPIVEDFPTATRVRERLEALRAK